MLHRFALMAILAIPVAIAEEDGPETAPAEAAFVFDNTACPAFLTGIWLANSQQDVAPGPDQALWHVTQALVLNEGGVVELAFASGIAGDEPEETKTFGTWSAEPGRDDDACRLRIAFEEGLNRSDDVRVQGQTRILVDGQAFTRAR